MRPFSVRSKTTAVLSVLGLLLVGAGCGKPAGNDSSSSGSPETKSGSSGKPRPKFSPDDEPAANKFCKGSDGTLQDCGIACDTTNAEDVCDLADKKAVGVCKRLGKTECDGGCKKGNKYLCNALKNYKSSTCAEAGAIYGKRFGDGFNEKAHVAADKRASLVTAAVAATTDSCTKDAWPADTIDCVAGAEGLGESDDCLSKLEMQLHSALGKGPSHNLTAALTTAIKGIADGAKQ